MGEGLELLTDSFTLGDERAHMGSRLLHYLTPSLQRYHLGLQGLLACCDRRPVPLQLFQANHFGRVRLGPALLLLLTLGQGCLDETQLMRDRVPPLICARLLAGDFCYLWYSTMQRMGRACVSPEVWDRYRPGLPVVVRALRAGL